ncbi:MAG: hypothetical protein BZY88_04720 [SAR202 cluster bacterium Io17-Chloro-G9]|nr:MAG: hypothetical protein BZY88_04720 [SAR202 cluster bacterium Io17-Chloro-G9]
MKNKVRYANLSLQAAAFNRRRFQAHGLRMRIEPKSKPILFRDASAVAQGAPLTSHSLSPRSTQTNEISWLPWGVDAFAKAQEENKPVLLSISAAWCHWCHVMDETTYPDTDVAELINREFIAIRVDSEHRPDINSRYNVGGWPTTAFLTGHGGLIGGATYLPPDQLLAMLTEVASAYRDQKTQLYDQARQVLHQRRDRARRPTAGPGVEDALVDRVARVVTGAYDARNGGFGDSPKFPNSSVLQFLLHLCRTSGEEFYRVMLEKTLDGMAGGPLFDREEGGFFRHSAEADWSEPQLEKLLEDNVGLAGVYLDAFLLLDRDDYRQVASQTVDYLTGHLYSDAAPGFHGSQGAHSEYFSVPLDARNGREHPPVDGSCYTGSNARAVTLLLEASWKLERPGLGKIALEVLAPLASMFREGRLSHVYSQAGPSPEPAFLADWSDLLNALLAAYHHTGQDEYLEAAKRAGAGLVDRFFDQDKGGFFDIEEYTEAIGYLQIREKHLPDNAGAAMSLLKLYHATRNEDYRQLAEAALSAFVEHYREYGEFSAVYGLAVHHLGNSPVEITIEGGARDKGSKAALRAMLQAAVRLRYPNLDIRPMLAENPDTPVQAQVCLETLCLPPVSNPDDLAATVDRALTAQESPFQNILDLFPGT